MTLRQPEFEIGNLVSIYVSGLMIEKTIGMVIGINQEYMGFVSHPVYNVLTQKNNEITIQAIAPRYLTLIR